MVNADFFIQSRQGYEIPVDISISYTSQTDERLALVAMRDISERKEMEALLRERQEALQTAQAIAHIGSWVWLVQPDELSWSDETYRIFGLAPQVYAPTYGAFMDRVHPDDRVRVGAAVARTLLDDTPYEVEHRVVRPDGSERIVLEKAKLFRDDDGEPLRMVGTIWDITERKEAERELQFDRAIIEGMSQPVVVVDQQGRIEEVNPAYCKMSGYGREEVLGRPSNVLKSGRHDQAYYQGLWESLARDKQWQGEIWIRRKDGAIVPRLLTITTICEGGAGCCRHVGFYSDISSLKESEAKLEKLAHFDQLTGLANRMLFHDRLRAAIARARRASCHVGLLFIDLDGFKQVNDTLGHRTGDMLLVEVAERMKHCVREDDTVARLGGDEFAVVLNELSGADCVWELAQRLLGQLQIELGGGAETLRVSASIGVALYPDHGESVSLLLEKADQAMYQAKQAGKNTVVFFDDDVAAGQDSATP
jgi:diguanylate cyclase (GGDEF)-like protein/PAS domain S-box-containing protein